MQKVLSKETKTERPSFFSINIRRERGLESSKETLIRSRTFIADCYSSNCRSTLVLKAIIETFLIKRSVVAASASAELTISTALSIGAVAIVVTINDDDSDDHSFNMKCS